MFVRNLLQAGDFITIVPAGIRITLQYSENGSLETVYTGFEPDKVPHPELLTPIIKSGEVPTHIAITKGTSYVYGCMYTNEVYNVEGKFHQAVEKHYISEYIKDPSKFHFFAGHMFSHAMAIGTSLTIQRWLKTRGFNILPSYLVPQGLKETDFPKLLNLDKYPFVYPRVLGYIRFRNGKYEFVNTNVRQMVVKSINKIVSFDGFILADIQSYDMGSMSVSYADVVNYNIHEGYIILVDEDNHIIYSQPPEGVKTGRRNRKINCQFCGKVLEVPKTSIRFTCTDEHCVSVLFNRVNNMLSKLGYDTLELERLREYAKEYNNILSLPDVLDMPEYKDKKTTIDAPNLLSAVVPTSIVTRFSDWTVFCNKCNNSVESIIYYVKNPDKMMFDLNLDGSVFRRFHTWLQSPENVLDITGVMSHPNVTVISTGKRFEGAPIFRGKSIYVTGQCMHGGFEDMRAILSSYSATVYDRFNTAVDCVIIGGLHEGVSGRDIQKAKQMQIPIFEEADFFRQYDIDSDIAANM